MTQSHQQSQKQHQAPSTPQSVATAPTQEDIAQRAYDIYAESGYQQGQSTQNWVRAEKELNDRGPVVRQSQYQGKFRSAPASADTR